jgi:aminoglycoside phosphotransferase (APT) family kinase protein
MPDQSFISRQKQITPSWLAGALRDAGHEDVGVRSLTVEPYRTKPYSLLFRLHVGYAGDPGLPERLLLKVARPDATNVTSRRRRRKESAFYASLAGAVNPPVSPAALAVACADDARTGFLLMEDLIDTHDRPPRGLPPTPKQAMLAVTAFGGLHAALWNHPDLRETLTLRDADYHRKRAEDAESSAATTLERFGPYLDDGIRHIITRHAEHNGPLTARAFAGPVSAIHGDAHPWNVLTPREGDGPALLIDWEAWTVDSPAMDIASFIVLRFDTGLRRRLESTLLDTWHAALVEGGLQGYSRNDLFDDYRRAIVRRVSMPLARVLRDEEPDSWFPILSRLALAWDDLSCDDVLT